MKIDEIIQIQTFFLMLFNSFFMILGVSVFGCAAWILFDTNSFIAVISTEGDVRLVAAFLALIGLVVIGVSVLGCVGGQLESKCLLLIYMVFLITITLGQLFVTFVLLLRKNKIEEYLNNKVDQAITLYGGNETNTHGTWILLDKVQRSVHCCGRRSPTDWGSNDYIMSLEGRDDIYPCSCFLSNVTCPSLTVEGAEVRLFGEGTDIYTEGCQEKLKSWLAENIAVIVGMDVGLIFIQVLQFTFAVLIYQNLGRKMKKERNLIGCMEVDPQTEPEGQDQGSNPDYHDQDYEQQDYQQQQHNPDYHDQDYEQLDYQQQQCNPDYHDQDYEQLDYQQQQYNQHDYEHVQYSQPDYSQQYNRHLY
ncbi:hypothetical protein ACEWY4_002193 [Coilia grayii]|uniref:Tetraspanin n=1 Tax=Coilia grayii TaxID=363190 RepID=A0ABD1KV39_9TELE